MFLYAWKTMLTLAGGEREKIDTRMVFEAARA